MNGFLETHNCKQCGKALGKHPAELYLGTYTGLCYECEAGPVFTVKRYEDNAILLSYSPQCPSWRRDREEYIAYADCKVCKGEGRIKYARSNDSTYYGFCETCLDRYQESIINAHK